MMARRARPQYPLGAVLEQAVNAGLRHEVALLVGKRHRQLSGAQLGALQCHLQYLTLHIIRDPVPCSARTWPPVLQSIFAEPLIQIISAVKSGPGYAQLVQRPLRWKVAFLDQSHDLELL